MPKKKETIPATIRIEPLIYMVRGQKIILDADLAKLYGVETKILNKAMKRNAERFPDDFVFQLDREELEALRFQIGTSKTGRGGRRYLPYAYTEHGAIMAANMLNSPKAVQMSVFVVRAFVKMRDQLSATQLLEKRLAEIEKALLSHDVALADIYQKIRPLLLPPRESKKKQIGFHVKEKMTHYRPRQGGKGHQKMQKRKR